MQHSFGSISSFRQSVFQISSDIFTTLFRSTCSLQRSGGLQRTAFIVRSIFDFSHCVGIWPSYFNMYDSSSLVCMMHFGRSRTRRLLWNSVDCLVWLSYLRHRHKTGFLGIVSIIPRAVMDHWRSMTFRWISFLISPAPGQLANFFAFVYEGNVILHATRHQLHSLLWASLCKVILL